MSAQTHKTAPLWAPPTKIAENPLFEQLRMSVAKETVEFTFACGGIIPIITPSDPSTENANDEPTTPTTPTSSITVLSPTSCAPVDLRWDPLDNAVPARQTKLTFPLTSETEDNLAQLLRDMQPATFGRGGEDVYDEGYRKAAKLDPSRFSSTFSPYELGIVDTVAQVLLPTLRHAKLPRAVRAELYKLNVYSGPHGKFKAHVDTPRSAAQFGSLVVCLPLAHKGGALEVRHNDRTLSFDWSSNGESAQPAISWAAFYSDCEHEVLEVTEGHRLTLTYNLYCVRGNGQLGGHSPVLDPTQLPLYMTVSALLQNEEGWNGGGYLGFHCNHVYPHTTTNPQIFHAPDNLKGVDMAMYAIFQSLGLEVMLRPTINNTYNVFQTWEGEVPLALVGAKLGPMEDWGFSDDGFRDWWVEWQARHHDETGEPRDPKFIEYDEVHWLNAGGNREPQVSYGTYGNTYFNDMEYSTLAMIVRIPSGGITNLGKADEESLAGSVEKLIV